MFWGGKMTALAVVFSVLALIIGGLPRIKVQAPYGFGLWPLKLISAALAPFGLAAGALGLGFALLASSLPAAILAGLGLLLSGEYFLQIVRVHEDFEGAFGPDWQRCIPPERESGLLARRWSAWLPAGPDPGWQRDIPFWIIPGSERKLLCDLWTPPAGVRPSGLAFIYLHGGNWYFLDKDVLTRPFFRHLADQGHVVMDVAYRLFPETDLAGMAADAKRAVAWMKANGSIYGVDARKIVLGGASAGGHLALLAAFAPYQPEMTPEDLKDSDLSVRAVISEYGPTNLAACYFHTNQNKTTRAIRSRTVAVGVPEAGSNPGSPGQKAPRGRLGLNKPSVYGAFVNILGRHLDEIPGVYACFSPDTYVHPGCPPTLQIKGKDDLVTPAPAMLDLHQKLLAAGVPSVSVVYPHTDHAFDLALPQVSPAAQASWYVVDRFLSLVG